MTMRPTALVLLAGLAAPIFAAAQSRPPASASARQAAPAGPAADSAGYFFLLGRYYESTGDTGKAVDAVKQAIALEPGSAELRAELAGLYARQDKAVEAVRTAEDALQYDPANREANRLLGTIYAALAEQRQPLRPGEDTREYIPRAVAALEKARQDRGDLNLDLMLGRLYLQTDAYDKSIPLLRRVFNEQSGHPDVAMLLASAEEGAGRPAEAIDTLKRALEENPRFVRGYVMLAELNEKQGRWDEAAQAYASAQKVGTRGVDLTTRRAAALINAGQGSTARDLLVESAARSDAGALVLYLYAAAQRQAGDLAGAEATARRLRQAAPDDPRGMYVLAQVLEARGDVGGAERSLRDLLQRDPADATALNYLGYMFAERGERLDEAVDLVQRALKIEPENPSFLDSLGWAYFQQGKLDLAEVPLSSAAEKLPNNSVVQEHLGDLRFRQGRFADAAAAWQRSLAGDGESIDRTRLLKKLQDAKSRIGAR